MSAPAVDGFGSQAGSPAPIRVLFVFAWLVVGGEETEVRLLAQHLDPKRFHVEVVACSRRQGMPEQTHEQLSELGVSVDRTPYGLSFEETVTHLAARLPAYDVVVACQNVPDIYPALERVPPSARPALIEHGGLVAEALGGPKHLTARYVGVCASIREAAAARMPGRAEHCLQIPSMVELSAFHPEDRRAARLELGARDDEALIGWVGRLDAKKRVEDFIDAAAIVGATRQDARFVVIGGPDAFMPEYAEQLRSRTRDLGLSGVVQFLGDRADVPRLLAGLDVLVWLSRNEGMPHVIAEAGAAALPVVATADNGAMQQIEHRVSGIFVPHEDPPSVAEALTELIDDAGLRARLGQALRRKVVAEYSVEVVIPQWQRLFEQVAAEGRQGGADETPWRSFFLAGFECSTHRRSDGVRLDVLRGTGHDVHAEKDYRLAASHGLRTMRDGLRWHLIEAQPGRYDWSSWLPMLRASASSSTQVIWDIWHAGTPDHVDIWSPAFVEKVADLANAAARLHREVTDEPAAWVPLNEISFYSFIAGQVGQWYPYAVGRGYELKCQLARAAIAVAETLRAVDPRCRLVWSEPLINVAPATDTPADRADAEGHHHSQFQTFDIVAGRREPQLGGRPGLLDVVGCNFYPGNQWLAGGGPIIPPGHFAYRPLAEMLVEVHQRYGRPILISETGAEHSFRAPWLHYIGQEVAQALDNGVPVSGICLYPVACYPGWDDDRHCETGLFGYPGEDGRRPTYTPLLGELQRQRTFFDERLLGRRPARPGVSVGAVMPAGTQST